MLINEFLPYYTRVVFSKLDSILEIENQSPLIVYGYTPLEVAESVCICDFQNSFVKNNYWINRILLAMGFYKQSVIDEIEWYKELEKDLPF